MRSVERSTKRSNLAAKKFKAIASELLGLCPILAYFSQSILLRGDTKFNAEILAFLALCDVMDMIQAITFGIIQPGHLEKAINKFLALCVEAGLLHQKVPLAVALAITLVQVWVYSVVFYTRAKASLGEKVCLGTKEDNDDGKIHLQGCD